MLLVCRRTTTILAGALCGLLAILALAAAPAPAQIANTGAGPEPTHDFEGFGHVVDGPDVLAGHLLAVPFAPADTPAEQNAADALLSPGTPENDLAEALDAMASATTAADADAARELALDILEGNPIAKKAYSGIPLLNWNAPAKVKTVPANGNVVINQVRWGEHMVSDTWMLEFDDATQPFTVTYRVAELGSASGGQLNPTPLLENGANRLGQHSAVQPLGIAQNLDTGTDQASRFTEDRGLGQVPEQTRNAVQSVTVAMPPAGMVKAILDPNLRPGHETATTLMPATDERIASARAAMGLPAEPVEGEPTAADRETAIERLAAASPERAVYDELKALPAASDPAFLGAANAAGGPTGVREMVTAMRSRNKLPEGVAPDPDADATIVLQNNEAYLGERSLRLAAGASLKVEVVNLDGFAHRISGFDLHDRDRIFGAEDWGAFKWGDSNLGDASPVIAPQGSTTFTVTPASDAFALWLGDLGTGDQANAVISLDRSVKKQEALRFGAGTSPVHSAADQAGNMWVTLAGVDTIAKVTPSENLADSKVEKFLLPDGKHEVDSAVAPLAPADITVDGRGIVWASLSSGNAIARIDPAAVEHGTSKGITKVALDPCRVEVRCQPEIPPVPNEQPTRRPTRIKSMIDGQGHTVLWFAEAGASNIGVLRVDQDGRQVNQSHFACGCVSPESLDLGPDGSVWYTQIFENRIGRVRPDPTRPYSESAVRIDHYDIPGSAPVPDVLAPDGTGIIQTSLPLSIAVDGRNRVWFSESALGGIAWLDPAQAVPNTSEGFTEIGQPGTDFRSPAAPADVTVDRGNNFWWAGEYGDQIEQVKPDASTGMRFRGSARRGLTEGPVADNQRNLWVVETGGNLITRISDVTDGKLRPDGLPAAYEADTERDALSGVRLRDAETVEVKVQRGAGVVASATAEVVDGRFTVADGDWGGTGDAVRADDLVRIQPHGPFERAELSFRVADLAVALQDDGSLAGHAKGQGGALADRVAVAIDGGETFTSGINGANGTFRIVPGTPVARTASGTVSWSGATVAGSFRTVTRFVPTTQPDTGGGLETPPAGGRGVTPPADAPRVEQPAPETPRIEQPSQRPPAVGPEACGLRAWLYFDQRKATALLLGMTRAEVAGCLGAVADGLAVRYRNGRVTGFTLTDARLRTSRGAAGVGSHLRLLRKQVPGLRRVRRTRTWRALLGRREGGRAEIRVELDRRSRARRIVVRLA